MGSATVSVPPGGRSNDESVGPGSHDRIEDAVYRLDATLEHNPLRHKP
jgi:hypothetical protein